MPKKRISDLMVERTKNSQERLEFWDTLCPGLGIRIGLTKKVWVLMYRRGGKARRFTLGAFPALRVAEARKKAETWRELLDRGDSPQELERIAGRARDSDRQDTVAKQIDAYLERHAKVKQKSWRDTARRLKILRAALGERPISSVTRRDIIELIDAQVERGLTTGANRLLAYTRMFFKWCVSRDVIAVSPAAGINAPYSEVSRDRVLSDTEIGELWRASAELGYPFGHAFRLLILTGQRVGETSSARWTDIDFGPQIWQIPAAANKSGRLHWVPLGPMALQLLGDCDQSGEWIFAANLRGPITGWSRIKKRLDEISGVNGWVVHDVRRTFATQLASLAVPRHITEALLNHAPRGADRVAAIYQRYDFADERRRAVNLWEAKLKLILGEQSANCELGDMQFTRALAKANDDDSRNTGHAVSISNQDEIA